MALEPHTFLNVGPQGTFRRSGQHQTTPADVDALFQHVGQTWVRKLAVHFHGGLIDETKGLAIAEKMAPVYRAAGCHPVTFVWETGLFETAARNLDEVFRSKLFLKLLAKLLRKGIEKLGVDVGGRGPGGSLTETEIEAELERDFPFADIRFTQGARGAAAAMDTADADLLRQQVQLELELEFQSDPEFQQLIEAEAPTARHLKRGEIVSTPEEGQRGLFSNVKAAISLAKIFYQVVKRHIRKRDHGFYVTVIEEILRALYVEAVGGWIWAGMKRAATQMWRPNQGLAGLDLHAGRYFVESLAAHQRQHGLVVDVVGHSAGAIPILEMFKTMAEAPLAVTIRGAFFLAPACTTKLFHQRLSAGHISCQSFRIFTMSDEYERKDRLLSRFYPYSLLYFVSGLTEDSVDEPILGMERFLSGPPFDDAYLIAVRNHVLEQGAGRLALSLSSVLNPAAQDGFRTNSDSHGSFDDEKDTRASLQYLLR